MPADHKDYRSRLLKDPAYALEAAKGEFIMEVTESICEIIQNNNIKRQDLAQKMNKSKGYISQLLNGSRNMTLATLVEIAHVIGYSPKIRFEEKDGQRVSIEPIEFDMGGEDTIYESKVAA